MNDKFKEQLGRRAEVFMHHKRLERIFFAFLVGLFCTSLYFSSIYVDRLSKRFLLSDIAWWMGGMVVCLFSFSNRMPLALNTLVRVSEMLIVEGNWPLVILASDGCFAWSIDKHTPLQAYRWLLKPSESLHGLLVLPAQCLVFFINLNFSIFLWLELVCLSGCLYSVWNNTWHYLLSSLYSGLHTILL